MADNLNAIGTPGQFSLRVEVGPTGRRRSSVSLLALALLAVPTPVLSGSDAFHPGYTGSVQGGERLSITANRTRGTAPAHFYFTTQASGFQLTDWGTGSFAEETAHYNELDREWTFGDEGALFTTIQEIDGNGDFFPWDRVYDVGGTREKMSGPGRPAGGRYLGIDSNIAYGPHVGRVFHPSFDEFDAEFAASGNRCITYTVTCYFLSRAMVRAGRQAIPVTQTVEVYDPRYQTVAADGRTYGFAADEIFEVSASGMFSPEVPVANRYSDWETAYTDGLRNSERSWVRFRRGEIHDMHFTGDITVPADGGLRFNTDYDKLFITAYGDPTDPRPILDYTQSDTAQFYLRLDTTNGEQAIADLVFHGPHHVADPEGGIHLLKKSAQGPVVAPRSGFGAVVNCHSAGFAVDFEGEADGKNYGLENCSWGGSYNYGYYSNIGVTNLSFNGCSGIDHKLTVFGDHVAEKKVKPIGSRKNPEPPGGKFGLPVKVHGCFRISHAGKPGVYDGYVSFNVCHFRSIGGWGDGYQPAIRMGGNGEEDGPMVMRTSQTRVFSSQGSTIASGVFKGTLYPSLKYYAGVYMQVIDNTGVPGVMSFGTSGAKASNTIAQILDTVPYGTGYECLFDTRDPDGDEPQDPALFDYDLTISYNAVYDERSAATYASRKGDLTLSQVTTPCYRDLVFEHNLIYSPNRPGTAGYNFPADTISHEMGIALDYPGSRRLPDEDAWGYKQHPTEARAVVYPDPDPTYATAQPVMI